MLGPLGATELLLIFAAFVLLFGAKKVPELAKAFGKSVGEFKKARVEMDLELKDLSEASK